MLVMQKESCGEIKEEYCVLNRSLKVLDQNFWVFHSNRRKNRFANNVFNGQHVWPIS